MSFCHGDFRTSLIQQDEIELTKSYTHLTWEDAEHTRTNDKGITYYTKIDEVMAFKNHKYQNYALDEVIEESSQTYQAYLSQLWQDLNGGSSIQSMSDLTKNPPYKLSDEERADLKEWSEEGTYLAFRNWRILSGQTEDDALTMTVRYGYEVMDEKPMLHHHIILEAKENQVIVAPMDGKVSLDGDNLILTSGKGLNKTQLTLYNVHTGQWRLVSESKQERFVAKLKMVRAKVTYQKVDDDTDKVGLCQSSLLLS